MNRTDSMRKQIRRVSLALGIAKRSQSPSQAAGQPETLAQFLADSKTRYLEDIHTEPPKGGEWTVAMGNEAGDLDSVASSIAFAWIQSQVHQKKTIALIQTQNADFFLRPENNYALTLAGITNTETQLLTVTDTAPFSPFPSQSFALVDHNRLGSSFAPDLETANVTAVVDHHEDEQLYPTASPRTIKPCGSCASHIALLCPSEVPPELATLLLTAVLIDTNGLKPGGKGTNTDIEAVAFLAPRSTYGASIPTSLVETPPNADWTKIGAALHKTATIKQLTKALKGKKEDVSTLDGRDLLRRDFKEYTYVLPWAGGKEVKVGLASVPVSLEAMRKAKGGSLEEALGGWVKERGLVVLGVLTSFKGKDGQGKARREEAWVVYEAGRNVEREKGKAKGKEHKKGKEKEKEKEKSGEKDAVKENDDEKDTGKESADKQDKQTKPTPATQNGRAVADGVDIEELVKRLWAGLEANGDLKLEKHKKFELEEKKLPDDVEGRVYKQGNAKANRKVVAPALKAILESQEIPEKPKKKKLFGNA